MDEITWQLVMICIGISLIGLESIIVNFVIIWFGISLILVGISGYIINYDSYITPLIITFVLSLLLLFSLRTKFLRKYIKEPEEDKNFLDEEGEGTIINGKVSYKGTFFNIKKINQEDKFKEGEIVDVISIKMNDATIKKL